MSAINMKGKFIKPSHKQSLTDEETQFHQKLFALNRHWGTPIEKLPVLGFKEGKNESNL